MKKVFLLVATAGLMSFGVSAKVRTYNCLNIAQSNQRNDLHVDLELKTNWWTGNIQSLNINYTYDNSHPLQTQLKYKNPSDASTTLFDQDIVVSKADIATDNLSYAKSFKYKSIDVSGLFDPNALFYVSTSILDRQDTGIFMRRTANKNGPIGKNSGFNYEFYKCLR